MSAQFKCDFCPIVFSRFSNKNRHMQNKHNHVEPIYECTLCGAHYTVYQQLVHHRRQHKPTTGFKLLRKALKGSCAIYRKIYQDRMDSFEDAFEHDYNDMIKLLTYEREVRSNVKVSAVYNCEFIKVDAEQEVEEVYEIRIRTPTWLLRSDMDVKEFASNTKTYITSRIEDFVSHGSGWILDEILYADLDIGACKALTGGCNKLTVKFKKELKTINKSFGLDQDCFFQAIGAYFTKSSNKTTLRRFIKKYITINIPMPVCINDISRFEKANTNLNVKINVLSVERGRVFPIYTSKSLSTENVINLVLWKCADKESGRVYSHYSLIQDLNKFLRKTYKTGYSKTYERVYYCGNCLSRYTTLTALRKHEQCCLNFQTQRTIYPREDSFISFKNFYKKFKVKYCGFFDLESCLAPNIAPCTTCPTGECRHKTVVDNEQKPITYSYVIVDVDGNVVHQKTYTGIDCVQHFLNELLDIEEQLLENLSANISMTITPQQQSDFMCADICHICEQPLTDAEENPRVRDHCHMTGDYLGAAHQSCNLKRRECKFIPFFAHNFTAYDSHFLLQCLKRDDRIKKVTALPLNSEKFRTIQINSYRFLDSLSFLNASLGELVDDLVLGKKGQKNAFPILKQMDIKHLNCRNISSLLRKGVFPYEHITSIKTLKEKNLPSKSAFDSKLSNSCITDADYQHAELVFDTFKCKNLKDYCELYCATDVALLAEVMFAFRTEMHEEHDLDCCHYISLPQMGYDLMLKKTGVEIELVSDADKLMFFEANINGGLSFINQRYCKATTDQKDVKQHVDMLYLDGTYIYISYLKIV